MNISRLHHLAVICSDYEKSKHFYCELLGLPMVSEVYRADRDSFKLDLAVPGGVQIELFSFPEAPTRTNYPEACGLRHLAFAVAELDEEVAGLKAKGIAVESIRLDDLTGKRYTFFADPDGLPIELYEE